MKKILIPILLIFMTLALGIVGLIMGANYGGNNGCFTSFFGLSGYEACGNVFGLFGLGIGLVLSLIIIRQRMRK